MTRKWHIDADGNVDESVQAFVDELKSLILSRHPEATFEIRPGGENPTAIFLDTYVDLDDPFEMLDEISDRVLDIQIDEGVPLHVLPLRTPGREIAHQVRQSDPRPAYRA